MLEASAKSSNILSALPDRLSSGLFARATACHLDAGKTLFKLLRDYPCNLVRLSCEKCGCTSQFRKQNLIARYGMAPACCASLI